MEQAHECEVLLAIYSVNLRAFSRAKGESAVAAAAYRAGVAFSENRTGLLHDYSRRRGVEAVETLLPPGAPNWASDPSLLWNAAEAAETRVNSRVARELLVALPHELPTSKLLDLSRAIGQHLVDEYKVAVQVALHTASGEGDKRNVHVHLLMSTRELGPHGFTNKVRCLDDKTRGPQEVEALRAKVAKLTNIALAGSGSKERVDHRTLETQARDAEARGDLLRAAQLTREPLRRVSRADVEAIRRGQSRRAVAENRQRRYEHLQRMDVFLAAVQRSRLASTPAALRPKPASATSGRRSAPGYVAQGRDAVVLTVQARQLAARERVSERLGRLYLSGLAQTVREGQRWLEAYVKAAGRRHKLESWMAQSDDRRAWELFRCCVQAHRAMRSEKAKAMWATRAWRHASAARTRGHSHSRQHLRTRPQVDHAALMTKWKQQRQGHWRRLRLAVARERQARAACQLTHSIGHAEVLRLRAELNTFEQALQERVRCIQLPSGPDAGRRPPTGTRPGIPRTTSSPTTRSP